MLASHHGGTTKSSEETLATVSAANSYHAGLRSPAQEPILS